MPLFEVETENHIVITWAEDGDAASAVVGDAYPQEHVMRLTKRPRDTWVISKSALGIAGKMDPCHTARDCLSKAEGDKVREQGGGPLVGRSVAFTEEFQPGQLLPPEDGRTKD